MPSKKNTTGSEIASLDMEDKGNTLSRRAVLQKGAKLAAAASVPSLVGLGSLTTSTPASAWGSVNKYVKWRHELPEDIKLAIGLEGLWNKYELLWQYDSAKTNNVRVTQNLILVETIPAIPPIIYEYVIDTWTMRFYEKTGEVATNPGLRTLDLSDNKQIILKHNDGSDIVLKSEGDRRKLQAVVWQATRMWMETFLFYKREGYLHSLLSFGDVTLGLQILQYAFVHPLTGDRRIMYLYGTRTLNGGDHCFESLDEPTSMVSPGTTLRDYANELIKCAGITKVIDRESWAVYGSSTLGSGWLAVNRGIKDPTMWTGLINMVFGVLPQMWIKQANDNANGINMDSAAKAGQGLINSMMGQGWIREIKDLNSGSPWYANVWYQSQIIPPASWTIAGGGTAKPANFRTPTPDPGQGTPASSPNPVQGSAPILIQSFEWPVQPDPVYLAPLLIYDEVNPHLFYVNYQDKSYVPQNFLNGPRLANLEM